MIWVICQLSGFCFKRIIFIGEKREEKYLGKIIIRGGILVSGITITVSVEKSNMNNASVEDRPV